ncbi:MAG: peptidylprolyl isomerase [Thiohalomonadales bacterium]
MCKVVKNKVVSITYRILDDKNEVKEQSDLPIDYLHGVDNAMFKKVEASLAGKQVGDEVVVELSPAEGFGAHDPNLTFTDDIANVPAEFQQIGAKPQFQNAEGEGMEFTVTEIKDGKLTVDANHLFAGKTMTFHVSIVNIRDATAQELKQKQPTSAQSGLLQ